MAALGFPMRVTEGLRTIARQQTLYAQGRTSPGKIVTNCDGVSKKSRHQAASDGLGHAVDCAFIGIDPFGEKLEPGEKLPADRQPWAAYGAAVQAVGLVWGGGPSFLKAGLNDRPHAELPS